MYIVIYNGVVFQPFRPEYSYEAARKKVRRLITLLKGKYQDNYSNLGFKIVKFVF